MRIHDRNAANELAANHAVEKQPGSTAASSKQLSAYSSLPGGDSIDISGLFRAVHNSSAARAATIEQLTASVQNGSYSVNPALVSRALVSETVSSQAQSRP
ncbi:MAG: flagellar biosynthesis anti-sigma factor FlgM [Acidobacteriota bacterium]|nr:flagellar biosynthesis anti-sigma factor FlgM [Acidobacteriota bacterium]